MTGKSEAGAGSPIWVPRERFPGYRQTAGGAQAAGAKAGTTESRRSERDGETRYENVLFLDVDGVLLTDVSFRLNQLLRRPLEKEIFDPLALWWLRWLVRRTGAAVVLSSSWRDGLTIDDPFCFAVAENLFRTLARNGTPFADATPLCMDGDKGTEIAAWLERFPCTRYMVLDDHDCFTLRPDVREHWVRVPNSRGLRGPEARAVRKGFRAWRI